MWIALELNHTSFVLFLHQAATETCDHTPLHKNCISPSLMCIRTASRLLWRLSIFVEGRDRAIFLSTFIFKVFLERCQWWKGFWSTEHLGEVQNGVWPTAPWLKRLRGWGLGAPYKFRESFYEWVDVQFPCRENLSTFTNAEGRYLNSTQAHCKISSSIEGIDNIRFLMLYMRWISIKYRLASAEWSQAFIE